MEQQNFIGFDGTVLQGYLYEAEKPKGIVQIAHGMQEYSKTYFKFAEYLSKKGYIVFLFDQRGHGRSCKSIKELGKVNGDIFTQTVNDHLKASQELKEKYNLPLYFIGHSYGSFIGQSYLHKNKYASKIILLGSSYMKTLLIRFGKIMANLTVLFKGKDSYATFIENNSFKRYKKHFKDASWITSDEKESKLFYDDMLNGTPFSAGFYKSMFSNQLKLYKNINQVDKNLPIGIFSGADDPVGNFGKGPKKLYEFYKKHGLNATLKIYPNMRHGILQEKEKTKVYKDILDFIEK
jgi:alpha-beta hydrolase superfamily lysophospholipase